MLWQWSAMKMNKKHHFKDIAKKKWVIQGFNSSLNYIMHGPVSSITLCWKYLDYGYTEQLFTFNKDYLEYHYLEKDFINQLMNEEFVVFLDLGSSLLEEISKLKEVLEELTNKEKKKEERRHLEELGSFLKEITEIYGRK